MQYSFPEFKMSYLRQFLSEIWMTVGIRENAGIWKEEAMGSNVPGKPPLKKAMDISEDIARN